MKSLSFQERFKAAGWHLLISLAVAIGCGALVFGLWYPIPYASLAGGVGLFFLISAVDVVMGPLLTLVAYNVEKTKAHLWRDLLIIGAMQLTALVYGVHTMYVARPVVLAAENYLFRVVAANEVDTKELHVAPLDMRQLSLSGPVLVGVRAAANGEERLASVQRALEGYDGGARPAFWEPYNSSRARIRSQMKSLKEIYSLHQGSQSSIEMVLTRLGKTEEQIGYLDVKARAQNWIVLLDRLTADPVEFVLID